MLRLFLSVVLLIIHVQNALGAVLTSIVSAYVPLNHHNTLPASLNGHISFVGEANGVTTYILNEPQDPSLTATFIEGDNVAVLVVSANPTEIASYSCDRQATQAICHVALMNPVKNQVVSQFVTTDSPVDSLALIEIGPSTAGAPEPSPTATASTSAPPPSDPNQGIIPIPQQNSGNHDRFLLTSRGALLVSVFVNIVPLLL